MSIICLTGSIGTGKSHAAKIFSQFGFWRWDADKIVHELLSYKGKAFPKVVHYFPEVLRNNEINREILGGVVFKDPKKLFILESILHPLVFEERQKFLNFARRHKHSVVLEIPLYFESRSPRLGKNIPIVVTASPYFIQKQRVMKRKGMTEKKFEGILKRQLSTHRKCQNADYVVKTSLSYYFTWQQIFKIVQKIRKSKKFK